MRSFLFYPRLAVSGMRRNKILYVPYLLAASLMVMLFYILSSMTWIVGNSGIKGGSSMSVLLMLSSVVCGLLTVLILFYLNGYVIKQRSREFGLYSVLGAGQREPLSAAVLGDSLLLASAASSAESLPALCSAS